MKASTEHLVKSAPLQSSPQQQYGRAVQQLVGFADNRLQAQEHTDVQQMADNSPHVKAVAQFQAIADSARPNRTGLPDRLKAGVENLSGYSMDDVNVHYDSDKPAQLQAHAYAQGNDIYLAPGQEEHLPHEAWHVVQQKQGRVKPTMQLKGKVNVNDDITLEQEADVMGVKSLQLKAADGQMGVLGPVQRCATVQRSVDSDLDEANAAIDAADGYANYLSAPLNGYQGRIRLEDSSGDNERRELAERMSGGLKVWAENYYNKTQAYLYEAQKANDHSRRQDQFAILGVDTDENPDLEVHQANNVFGSWDSKAVEFKASTSPNYDSVASLVRKGLQQLEKREVAKDSYRAEYSMLILTVHNGNANNPYPMTQHMIDNQYYGDIRNVPNDAWNARLESLLQNQVAQLNIVTPLEIRMEYDGRRYATAQFN